MVTERLIDLVAGFASFVIGLVPAPGVPAFFTDATNAASSVGDLFASVSVWFPLGLVAAVLTAWALTWGVGVSIKVVRIVASFFTAGGGSAA